MRDAGRKAAERGEPVCADDPALELRPVAQSGDHLAERRREPPDLVLGLLELEVRLRRVGAADAAHALGEVDERRGETLRPVPARRDDDGEHGQRHQRRALDDAAQPRQENVARIRRDERAQQHAVRGDRRQHEQAPGVFAVHQTGRVLRPAAQLLDEGVGIRNRRRDLGEHGKTVGAARNVDPQLRVDDRQPLGGERRVRAHAGLRGRGDDLVGPPDVVVHQRRDERMGEHAPHRLGRLDQIALEVVVLARHEGRRDRGRGDDDEDASPERDLDLQAEVAQQHVSGAVHRAHHRRNAVEELRLAARETVEVQLPQQLDAFGVVSHAE